MLEVRAELLTIAQIAIAIAGFSGIVAAFLQRDGFHEFDRLRFVHLFLITFGMINSAFVPIAISQVIGETARIWSYSSGVFLVAAVTVDGTFTFHNLVTVTRSHMPIRSFPISWTFALLP